MKGRAGRADSQVSKESGAHVPLGSCLAERARSLLCLNGVVDRIAVAVVHRQGCGERPWPGTAECMLRWKSPRVRGRRKGHGSWRLPGVDEQLTLSMLFLFSAPRRGV